MNGPCLLPSGRRFGPYFERRCETSVVSKPFLRSVFSRRRTSSAATACQAGTSPMGLAIAVASICSVPSGYITRLSGKIKREFLQVLSVSRMLSNDRQPRNPSVFEIAEYRRNGIQKHRHKEHCFVFLIRIIALSLLRLRWCSSIGFPESRTSPRSLESLATATISRQVWILVLIPAANRLW